MKKALFGTDLDASHYKSFTSNIIVCGNTAEALLFSLPEVLTNFAGWAYFSGTQHEVSLVSGFDELILHLKNVNESYDA